VVCLLGQEASGPVAGVPSGRPIAPQTPAYRVWERIRGGERLCFIGAATPFRARILRRLGHSDVWLSSFEIAALLGERDDESIDDAEIGFFFRRIRRQHPELNLFVDCDTGWTEDSELCRAKFSRFAAGAALVCVQNLRHGEKDNSFRGVRAGSLLDAEATARRLRAVAAGCSDCLVALRIENAVAGQGPAEIARYLRAVRDAAAPVDLLLIHQTRPDLDALDALVPHVREALGGDVPLATVATAYARTPRALEALAEKGFAVVVVPNFAVRCELRALEDAYRRLAAGELALVEAAAEPMAAVFDLVYGPAPRAAAERGRRERPPSPKRRLFSPGPTNVAGEVRAGLLLPDMCHREAAFKELLARVRARLVALLGGEGTHEAVLLGTSGTGALECILAALPGKSLVLDSGRYARRLTEILRRHGKSPAILPVPRLAALDPAAVAAALAGNAGLANLVVVHLETTTGLLLPLPRLGEVCAALGRRLVVDAVASAGAHSFDLCRDNVAFCAVSPNKCFEAPPGISFAVGAAAELARLPHPAAGVYLDLREHWQRQRAGEVRFTVPVPIVGAFDRALDRLAAEGPERRGERYRRLQDRLRWRLAELGVRAVELPDDVRANTIVLLELPPGVEYERLQAAMAGRGYVVYSDPETVAASRFFVATMGDLDERDVDDFAAALAGVCAELARHAALAADAER
jgi:2-aminoethylphosphonate-pyruvate transaminase